MVDQGPAVAPVFPESNLPTVFADGIANLANSQHVVKFYLYRVDPSINSPNESKTQIFAQVCLPISAFLQAHMLFEQALGTLVAKGILSQQQIDDARRLQRGEGA